MGRWWFHMMFLPLNCKVGIGNSYIRESILFFNSISLYLLLYENVFKTKWENHPQYFKDGSSFSRHCNILKSFFLRQIVGREKEALLVKRCFVTYFVGLKGLTIRLHYFVSFWLIHI